MLAKHRQPLRVYFKSHWNTHSHTKLKMSQPACMVSSECQPDLEWNLIFMYRLWLKLSSRACCPLQYDIHSGQQHCILLPLTLSQYLKGYAPPAYLTQPASSTLAPRGPPPETDCSYMSTCNIYIHHCESPLKMAQLLRCSCWDRSVSKSASALLMDNHGSLLRGEREPDFGV